MSSLISELMRRRETTAPARTSTLTSEPNFNPLAGARDSEPRKPLRPWLIGLGYLAFGGVIIWQGWQLLPGQTTVTATGPSVEPATVTAPIAGPEVSTPTETVTPPSDLTQGTQDLPPLAPTAPPEPVEEADTPDSLAATPADESPEPVEALVEAVTPIAEPTSEAASQPSDPPEPAAEEATGSDSADPTAPAIARVDDTSASTVTGSSTATFSSTRRNRELRDAQALYQAGDIDQALAQLGAWLRQDDHTDVRQYYARLLLRADQPEAARYVLQPRHSMRELELRAYADFRADAFSDALRHYSELLQRSDNPQQEWYLWVAICHDNLNQTTQAVAMFENYLQQTTGQPDSLIQHARERMAALSG